MNRTKTALLSFVVVPLTAIVVPACTSSTDAEESVVGTEQAALVPGETIIFKDNFDAPLLDKKWMLAFDGSPQGCKCAGAPPPSIADVGTWLSRGWPAHGGVLSVHSNVGMEPCTNANAIVARDVGYTGRGNYRVELDMRQWRTDGVYKSHQSDVNYTFSRYQGYDAAKKKHIWVDRFTEVGIIYDRNNKDYGGRLYMKKPGSSGDIKVIADLRSNPSWATDWHHIIVNNIVSAADGIFRLASVYCDGKWYVINEPMGTFYHEVERKEDWGQHERILLEGANVYTNCSNSVTHAGVALYDNVQVSRIPF